LQLVNGITAPVARSAVAMVREAGSNKNPTGGLVLTNDILGKLLPCKTPEVGKLT